LDGLPSSAFIAKLFTGARFVKGFNHLVATMWPMPRTGRALISSSSARPNMCS